VDRAFDCEQARMGASTTGSRRRPRTKAKPGRLRAGIFLRSLPPARRGDKLPDEVSGLVARGLEGDQSALTEIVERFRGEVFGLCYRMLGHRQDAEDVAQESFIRALRSLANWDTQRDFRPWLLAIAGNRCRSMLAARMRRPRPTDDVEEIPDRKPDEQGARHLAEEVQRALLLLREEYRLAFVLFHEQHLSYAEIAESLLCPLGTVKTWVHRARRELADHLQQRGVVQQSETAKEPQHAVRRI